MMTGSKPLMRLGADSAGRRRQHYLARFLRDSGTGRPRRGTASQARIRATSWSKHAGARSAVLRWNVQKSALADLHAAFADPETSFVAAVRGGYGSNYLLEALDLALIADHPKPFFAYSDMTGLQLRLLDQLGLPAFHGPMVAADFYLEDGVHLESFQAALAGQPYSVGGAEGMRTLKPGTARGTLYGGCLSILSALIGTPWEPATENKLLFIEDVAAKPYQVDRMLWQLREAGKLDGVRGIVFGEMLDCTSPGAPDESARRRDPFCARWH